MEQLGGHMELSAAAPPPPPKVYVRFGPRPTQEIPIEWAEQMLTIWFERHQPQFGKVLSEVALQGGRL